MISRAKLNTALMANDPGYDILNMDYSDPMALYKMSGMFRDLSGNAVIAENIAQWTDMPFLYESDGSLYGIPVIAIPYGFRITRALWNEINVDIDKNWTWDDFFSLADIARELGLFLVEDGKYWNVIRTQYESKYCDIIDGEANYDTETFRKLASMWKQLEEEGLIAHEMEESSHVLLEFCPMDVLEYGSENYVYLGMPAMDGEIVTPIRMDAFYINRYSEHADAAEEFMEIYTSPEVQNWSFGGMSVFLPDMEENETIRFHKEHNLSLAGILPVNLDEALEEWQYYLRTGNLYEAFPADDDYLVELIESFVAAELTLEEFILEAQERADLMIGE